MAELTTHENLTDQNGQAQDLKLIRGIGAIKKRWLKSAGIRTIEDLSRALVDEIESQFKQAGRAVSRSEIAGWVVQAQAIVAEELSFGQPEPFTAEAVNNAQLLDAGQPASKVTESTQAEVEKTADLWRTIAAFRVEVQTTMVAGREEQRTVVHYGEPEQIGIWTGIEIDQLSQWMRSHLDSLQSNLKFVKLVEMTPVAVKISQLRLLQATQTRSLMVADQTQRLFPDSIRPGEPFALEALIEVAGPAIAELETHSISYHAECQAKQLATGKVISLGDLRAEIPYGEPLSHTLQFPKIVLEQPGAYRLQVVVTPQNLPATPGSFKVPLLQVV